MEGINEGFYFVLDLIVSLQVHFTDVAWAIGKIVFSIALLMLVFNYAITGQGIKENAIKLLKATIFFFIVMHFYPDIIGAITKWSYEMARDSTYTPIKPILEETKKIMADDALNAQSSDSKGTAGNHIMLQGSDDNDPLNFFPNFIQTRKNGNISYSTVAPAAALRTSIIVAENCFKYAADHGGITAMGNMFKGLISGFFVVITSVFAILEYLIAYLEFMFVAAVGIILFPLSLWDGSKFMSEKFVGALIGFFLKLLFCNICIFLMLYGFLLLAKQHNANPFLGAGDQILLIVFICLLFFFICKSAPGMAQGLLSGSPSLNAAGAIGAVSGAMAAASFAGKAGGAVAGGVAKTAFNTAGAVKQMTGAMGAVKEAGGGFKNMMGAAGSSLGKSASEGVKAMGHDLSRSLLGGGKGGGGAGGADSNKHSQRKQFLGNEKTLKEHMSGRKAEGAEIGKAYMEDKKLDKSISERKKMVKNLNKHAASLRK
jgi:hypothetical protein